MGDSERGREEKGDEGREGGMEGWRDRGIEGMEGGKEGSQEGGKCFRGRDGRRLPEGWKAGRGRCKTCGGDSGSRGAERGRDSVGGLGGLGNVGLGLIWIGKKGGEIGVPECVIWIGRRRRRRGGKVRGVGSSGWYPGLEGYANGRRWDGAFEHGFGRGSGAKDTRRPGAGLSGVVLGIDGKVWVLVRETSGGCNTRGGDEVWEW